MAEVLSYIQNHWLVLLFLVLFFAVTIVVGIYSRKKATDVNGFVLGGRAVGPWLSAFSFGTSYFSAVIFVGYAGRFGWNFGLASTWIGLGNALIGSYLAWKILGRRTRVMTQHLGSSTMPDFFEKRYGSKSLKIMASLIIFVFMIPYTASLYNGLSRLFNMAFGAPYWICVVAMAVFTGIYVVISGYVGTAVNSLIQGIVMLIGIVVVVVSVLQFNGGLSQSIAELAKQNNSAGLPGAYTSFMGPDPLALIGVVLLTSLGTWGLPQMIQKYYSIKDEKSIKTGTIVSTVFAIVVAGGCYFLGGFGRIFMQQAEVDKNGFDSIIPRMLELLQSDLVIALVIILVLAASMSTLSSLVLTSSATLTLDCINPLSGGNMREKSKLSVMRILLVVFIVISAVIAIIQANSKIGFISDLMGISWGAMAGAFLAPFLYGLYSRRITKPAVWTSFIFSVCIMLVDILCPQILPELLRPSSNCGVFAMLFGLVAVPVISLLTHKPDKAMTDSIFSCYDKKVAVSAKDALGDQSE